ncbi:MAG TPA: fumarylacetoacetate hydrolase family protein [Ktedonosporobacter sp.]|jgi:2-keto-4-pentenoate hydratase/2-oxohepta-3-ene-1,7-dioic acid hydratase in catechol pathway|nr:fumarylacetoacetate hydrolase family protein [Ktedonosporobacter sp.]
MKLGRILRASIDQAVPRLVAVLPERNQVLDLATMEYHRLLRGGATAEAAQRLATALFPSSMSAAIGAGTRFLEAAQACLDAAFVEDAVFAIDAVKWLSPLDPSMMRDCLAFEQHLRNAFLVGQKRPIPDVYYEMPVYYKGNRFSVIGHEQEVPWPDYTQYMDYELELGFVIGRDGYDLSPDVARSHLFGVTIYNDFSARDIQRKEGAGGLGPAKGKDFATGLGPWITTADEVDVHNLSMVARVNGEEWSRGSSADLMWRVEEIIAYVSKAEGVHAGELIGSGTVGFGCALELGRQLQPGDVVELEVSGIGTLRNRIGTPGAKGWTPSRRPSSTTQQEAERK